MCIVLYCELGVLAVISFILFLIGGQLLYKVVLISPAQQPESAVSIHISGLPCLLTGKKICLPMQKMQVRSLGREGPLKKEMATHLSIIAWEMSQTEEPGGLQCLGSQRV